MDYLAHQVPAVIEEGIEDLRLRDEAAGLRLPFCVGRPEFAVQLLPDDLVRNRVKRRRGGIDGCGCSKITSVSTSSRGILRSREEVCEHAGGW